MGSLEFTKLLLNEANVAVSPGIGFGDEGDEYVRFSLIQEPDRIADALSNIQRLFRQDAYGTG